ncbi:FAD:protein FMN transferase [Polystyrenella longa]|nr:FAD:protein FMN transferase [Polystyrenella longa]
MGTYYDVRFNELPPGETNDSIRKKLEAELKRINDLMSTWQADSQLMKFNTADTTDWFPVDADVEEVVSKSLEISEMTDGSFDVTVGPLIELWNFGVEREEFKVPTEEELDGIKEYVGWHLLETRGGEPALKKRHPRVFLNLSAIAKGYGVDLLGLVLEEAEIQNYLVNIGGEMVARGKKPNGVSWTVAIERPTSQPGTTPQIVKTVSLNNRALATSGNYRNFFEDSDGNTYSHTIDPRTSRPVTHQLQSASVLADNCMLADALATSLMVMGPEEAKQFAIENNLAIFLVYPNGEGGSQEEWSSAEFTKYLNETAKSGP